MTLPVPYIVYGTITVDSVAQGGATVSVGSTETTTDANGLYQLNIQSEVSDGDTVTVTATYSGDSNDDSFTLSVSDAFKNIDIDIISSVVSGKLYIYGTKPISIYGDNKMYIYKV